MQLLTWLGATLAGTAFAHVIRSSSDDGDWCGTVATKEWLRGDSDREDAIGKRTATNSPSIIVDTYFHVVANSTRVEDGYLTDKMVLDQFKVLNQDYASSDISFRYLGVSRTVNRTWATSDTSADILAMKRALRRGTYSTLNVYFRTLIGESEGGTLLGRCTLPDTVTPGSTDFYRDGCMVLHSTVPGGSRPGKTTTHEVGHWFGLLHTFEGGCTGTGDGVADTPAEASPSRGCDLTRDTCPGQPGNDPVTNFMDYSPAPCRSNFTPGQSARMHGRYNFYRAS